MPPRQQLINMFSGMSRYQNKEDSFNYLKMCVDTFVTSGLNTIHNYNLKVFNITFIIHNIFSLAYINCYVYNNIRMLFVAVQLFV